MLPYFELFGSRVYTFNVLLSAALLSVVLLAIADCKRSEECRALENKVMVSIPFFVLAGSLTAVLSDCLFRGMSLRSAGATFLGWLLGAMSALWVYAKLTRIKPLFLFNFFLPSFACAQAFGRIGCFLGGCCYGKPGWWGVAYPQGSAPYAVYGESVLWPVQLFEAAYLFFVFFLCRHRIAFPYRAGVYLLLIGLGRFLFEFLRGDDRGTFGGQTYLSPAQILCLSLCVLGYLIVHAARDSRAFQDAASCRLHVLRKERT